MADLKDSDLINFLKACVDVTRERPDTSRFPEQNRLLGAPACETNISCYAPSTLYRPEHTLVFREPVRVYRLNVLNEDDGIRGRLVFGSDPADVIDAGITIDLIYEQRWFFERPLLGSTSSTLALGPGERLRFSLQRTQRKQLTRTAVEEVDRATNRESTFFDRDVLNVTRSSAMTSNWSISGTGQIGIPEKASLGLTTTLGQTLSDTSSRSAEHISEATIRSASNLRVLCKTEVQEIREATETSNITRTIVNPSLHRSLTVLIYDLFKQYSVNLVLTALSPAIRLPLRVHFNRQFVLSHGDFLQTALDDNFLQYSLMNAINTVAGLPDDTSHQRAVDVAKLGLRYLFEVPNIFHSAPLQPGPVGGPLIDTNLISNCFVASQSFSGLQDSISEDYGLAFSILNFYYAIYVNEYLRQQLDDSALLYFCQSLYDAIQPLWPGDSPDNNKVRGVLDNNALTEIFRRMSGFLAFVKGVVKPYLENAEQQRQSAREIQNAEFIIRRIVEQLTSYNTYYTKRYLEYVSERTESTAIQDFAKYIFRQRLIGTQEFKDLVAELFDPANAFLSGCEVVVPTRRSLDEHRVTDLLRILGEKGDIVVSCGLLSTDCVVVPTDGTHVEPLAGNCTLNARDKAPGTQNIIGTWLVLGPIFDPAQQKDEHDSNRAKGNEPKHAWAETLISGIDVRLSDFDPASASAGLDKSPKEGDVVTYGGDEAGLVCRRTYVWRRRSFIGMNWDNLQDIDNNIHFHLYGDMTNDPFESKNYLNFAGKHHALAFFAVYIEAREDGARKLYVRSDDALRAWLNGHEIHELQHIGERDVGPVEDCADVMLKKGWNVMVLAVAETHVEWALSARFEPTTGLRITTTHPFQLYAGWPACNSKYEFICIAGEGNLWNANDPQRLLYCTGQGVWRGQVRVSKEEFKFVANGDLENLNWGLNGSRGGPNLGPMDPGIYDVIFDENNPASSILTLIHPLK